MTDRALGTMAPEDLRAGLRVSALSIGWTLSSSTAAVAIGMTAGSLVLVAFGLTGVLDAVGSATLVVHFRARSASAASLSATNACPCA